MVPDHVCPEIINFAEAFSTLEYRSADDGPPCSQSLQSASLSWLALGTLCRGKVQFDHLQSFECCVVGPFLQLDPENHSTSPTGIRKPHSPPRS
jgi:hypothetical protein